MEFTIQYFGAFDLMLHTESVEVAELVEALDRARAVVKEFQLAPDLLPDDPQIIGYVILDRRGRQVARGYRRERGWGVAR
jgi:hypothetical protein